MHFSLVDIILNKDSSGGFSINIEVLRNDILKDIKLREMSIYCKTGMHSKLRSFMFVDVVISSSYGAHVYGTELKEEYILGHTHEKFFYFDPGKLNFSYVSGMVFLVETETEVEAWPEHSLRAKSE